MSEVICHWDAIVHKNVRTMDNIAVGNIVAVDNDSIVIVGSSFGSVRGEYKIPKSKIEVFNGAEVFLNLHVRELRMFKV
jgi:hypothetical protein